LVLQAFAWFSDLLVEHSEIFWSLFAVDMDRQRALTIITANQRYTVQLINEVANPWAYSYWEINGIRVVKG
jgi:hypothetical protein